MIRGASLACVLSFTVGLSSCDSPSWAWGKGPKTPEARVVASCDFEGAYSQGEQQIHTGCVNNWQWGRKDMLLRADKDTGLGGVGKDRAAGSPRRGRR
jgi:hypothetical protein